MVAAPIHRIVHIEEKVGHQNNGLMLGHGTELKKEPLVLTTIILGGSNMTYVPVTPGGTPCTWLASDTEEEAWQQLLQDAAHMPYGNKEGFIERGYTVECWPDISTEDLV